MKLCTIVGQCGVYLIDDLIKIDKSYVPVKCGLLFNHLRIDKKYNSDNGAKSESTSIKQTKKLKIDFATDNFQSSISIKIFAN